MKMGNQEKVPLSIDNFYTSDGYDGRMRNIYHLSPYLSWVGGCPYYGFSDGTPCRWGVYNEPTHLHKVTDENQAIEFAARIELKTAKKKIIEHLDEIARLGKIVKKYGHLQYK